MKKDKIIDDKKVKKKKPPKKEAALVLEKDITLRTEKAVAESGALTGFPIILVAALSCIFMLTSFFELEVSVPALAIYILATSLIFCLAGTLTKKSKLLRLLFVFSNFALVALFWKYISNGFLLTVDAYLKVTESDTSYIAKEISDISKYDYYLYTTVFLMFLSALLISGMVLARYFNFNFIIFMLITFPFFEIGMYWGLVPDYLSFFGIVVCWITVFTMHLINHIGNAREARNTFILRKRSKVFYLSSEKFKVYASSVIGRTALAVSLCLFLLIGLFTQIFGYERSNSMNELRDKIKISVENFSFESFLDNLDNVRGGFDVFSGSSFCGINEGELGGSSKVKFKDSTALVVKTQGFKGVMYLKGYVAGEYTGNSWDQLSEETYKNSENYSQLMADGIMPQDLVRQNAYNSVGVRSLISMRAVMTDGGILSDPNSTADIQIKEANPKYLYSPYLSYYTHDLELSPFYDSYMKNSEKNYSINYYAIDNINDIYNKIFNAMDSYNYDNEDYDTQSNIAYNNFVQENYLNYDMDDVRSAYNEITRSNPHIASPEGPYSPQTDYTQKIDAIKSYFADNFKYTLSPGKTPKNKDFVKYFLEDQKEGYCTYFASAGVLLLRSFGLPARYVEGYVLDDGQLSAGNASNGTFTVDVKDRSAHAWAEVYVPDFGWIPVEFTPGYSDGYNPNISNGNRTAKTTKATSKTYPSVTTPPVTTTKPNVTTPSQHPSTSEVKGSTGTKAPDNTRHINRKLFTYVFSGTVLIIFVAVIIIKRKVSLRRIDRGINSDDPNISVVSLYKLTLRYLALLKITSKGNKTDLESVSEFEALFKEKAFEEHYDSFEKLTEIALKGDMSDYTVTDEELEFARKTKDDISSAVRSRLNVFGVLSAKYIDNVF